MKLIKTDYLCRKEATTMKIYISGKVTGLPYEEALENFRNAETELKEKDYDVVNPAALGLVDNWEWADYMMRDLGFLKDCDAIYMLNNWKDSAGARTEYEFAKGMGIEIVFPKQ